jgi:hypothetical protein
VAQLFPSTFPSGQGSDLAGVIEEAGDGVDGFSPRRRGDRVLERAGLPGRAGTRGGRPFPVHANGPPRRFALSWIFAFVALTVRGAETAQTAGFGQGDLNGHGGEQRAVPVYQIQSHQYWQRYFGREESNTP